MEAEPAYPVSELAFLFPDYQEEGFEALVENIRRNGLLEEITVWQGEIIDGRHRELARVKAGVQGRYRFLPDDDNPVLYLVAKNDPWRNLDDDDRAKVAHKLSLLSRPGRPRLTGENYENFRNFLGTLTQQNAADLMRVNLRLVSSASRVYHEDAPTTPDLLQALDRKSVKLSDAERVLREQPEIQRRAVALLDAGDVRTVTEGAKRAKREMAERDAEAAASSEGPQCAGDGFTLFRSTLSVLRRQVEPGSVNILAAAPPKEAGPGWFAELSALAAHALSLDGVMAIVGAQQPHETLARLKHPDLEIAGRFVLLFPQPFTVSEGPHWLEPRHLPVLVYGKPGSRLGGGEDVIEVPGLKTARAGRPMAITAGMEAVVYRFAQWRQVVCVPILCGGSGAALAARTRGCAFIGADCDGSRLDLVAQALLSSNEGDEESGVPDREERQMSFA